QYPMAGKQTFASFRGEYGGNYGAATERSRASVLQHSAGFEADAYVPVWTSQLFISDWLEPGTAPLTMVAIGKGPTWTVTITNESDRAFTNAHVVVGGRVHDIGALLAGKTKTFELDDSQGTPIQQFAQRYADAFHNAVQQRNQSFGGNAAAIDSIPRACVAASFASQVNVAQAYNNFTPTDGLDLSAFANNATAILFAWDEGHSYTQPFNQFKAGRSHRSTMLRLVQPVKNQI
ncbi:MAG: hypothetical protein JWO95_465, partial [Verrucomicrobiales bacterium]|nr:hypothetical protein [Verrucomicrobiales bacterium]